jgi:hypothetical protein
MLDDDPRSGAIKFYSGYGMKALAPNTNNKHLKHPKLAVIMNGSFLHPKGI